MVVEDDILSAVALRAILRAASYEVEMAETLYEARVKLTPDHSWVLLDLMLPDGNGEKLLFEIRDAKMPICVAVMTGCGDAERMRNLQQLKPEFVMCKPIDVDDLLSKLSAH